MPNLLENGVTVIIPVFNEAKSLPGFLPKLKAFYDSFAYPIEIILVDDGSTDNSAALLHETPFNVILHEGNRGYGASIKTGITTARYESLVILDADGTYALEDVMPLLESLHLYDMVIGARLGTEAKIPLIRRPAKWVIKHFASWLVQKNIPDLNSGLRAFRRGSVNKIIQLLPDGFSLTTTITIAFHASGRRVHYLPIQYNKRTGSSKFHPISDTWNLILLILRTVVLIRPLNVFVPLSFLLAIAGIISGLVTKYVFNEFMDATFIVLMVSSIQMFVLGLIADLIVRINLWTH